MIELTGLCAAEHISRVVHEALLPWIAWLQTMLWAGQHLVMGLGLSETVYGIECLLQIQCLLRTFSWMTMICDSNNGLAQASTEQGRIRPRT